MKPQNNSAIYAIRNSASGKVYVGSAARKRTEEMKKQAQSPLMGYALKERQAADAQGQ